MNKQQLYTKYQQKMRQIADVAHAIAVLNWDQETYLPENGAGQRAQQIATLSGILHEMSISTELGDLLNDLKEGNHLDERQSSNIRESWKGYQKSQKYSKEFVVRLSQATSAAYQAWIKARTANDFSLFEPSLTNVVALKREETELIGYKDHPYDVLLDDFEPGAKTADLNRLFADVRQQLVDFVQEINAKSPVADQWMYQNYDKDKQWNFGIHLLQQMGYDFKAGRQDLSAHPFTTSFGSKDVRVTTRIATDNFHEMTWSCIHEGGHALYEQGLLEEDYGLPTGAYLSLGIHESQSRLWENNVGRSLPYWKSNYKNLQQLFPENLNNVALFDFYKSMNGVKPSLIRTNADELTYHFHILVRFEIEKSLIEGSIEVKDLPAIWNQRYKEYLNVDVPSDKMGVLQDIHWSHGSFGYFPTYSLGSFYAAQFYQQANKDLPNMEGEIEKGNMKPLLTWLQKNVHEYGRMYSADELCQRITGEPLNFSYFMDYARQKYSAIYGL